MSLIWYSTNNTVDLEDLPDLEALGIMVGRRLNRPVNVYRDPDTGRMIAELGRVTVFRDGRIRIRRRVDCPDGGLGMLARTALDCHERDLHLRDGWAYYRVTKNRPVGLWSMVICASLPEGTPVFSAHTEALRQAASPLEVGDDESADSHHTRA